MTEMNSDADGMLRLPTVLDLASANDLLAVLRERLASGSPLHLDASGVETLTLPCIQIILAAIRTYDVVSIDNPSAAFVSAFSDLGLEWTTGERQGFGRYDDQDHSRPIIVPQDEAHANQMSEDREREQVRSGESLQDESPMNGNSLPKRILTIDDSKTMRDMLMLTLADAGFEVLQAVDGQDGVDMLRDQKVDVVITDINMPKMDGYGVIRHLRGNPDHKTTPILVLTTESDTDKKDLAREAGATGWMVKPFDPDRLIATIRKISP